MVNRSTMQTRYPDLIDYDDETSQRLLNTMILDAEMDVDDGTWGALYDRGVAALTAHRMELKGQVSSGDASASFPIQQSAADGVSATFETPKEGIDPEHAHYYTTQYGVEYMELFKRVASGPRLV